MAARLTSPPAELIAAVTVIVSGGSMSNPPAPTLIAPLIATLLPEEVTLIESKTVVPPTTPLKSTLPLLIIVTATADATAESSVSLKVTFAAVNVVAAERCQPDRLGDPYELP